MEINKTLLQNLGLSDKESTLYTLLLELGQVQASILTAKTGLKRATVYKSLYALIAKGLVRQQDIQKKLHFAPLAPDNLLKLSDEQFDKQERARLDLQGILPVLTSQYILSVEKPVISTFEGVEGLKKIYEDTLNSTTEILAIVQKGDVDATLLHWLDTVYIKHRIKLGIPARVIVSGIGKEKEEYIEKSLQSLRTIREVNATLFPIYHEVNIYGDKIAFINYKKGESLIGIIIHHPTIAMTMKSFFELAWIGSAVS